MALAESGTEKTQSAPSAGCSRASCRPSSRRTRSTDSPNTVLSGRAEENSPDKQRLPGRGGRPGGGGDLPVLIRTKKPGPGSPGEVGPDKTRGEGPAAPP